MGGGGGGVVALCLILKPRRYVRSENFFKDSCSKDEPTGKNLICEKLFPFLRKIGKTCWGGGWHPPPLAIGGLSVHKIAKFEISRK